MARRDDRLSTDDFAGPSDREAPPEDGDERGGLLGSLRRGRDDRRGDVDRDRRDDERDRRDDERDRRGEEERVPDEQGAARPAGGDISGVRTEGGRVHVERERPADEASAGVAEAEQRGAGAGSDERRPLLDERELEDFRRRWDAVQTAFVDEPRRAVEEADALVAGVMQRLADGFSAERRDLESRWDRGDDVDTENLRVALQRYRSFFNRLLSA